MYPIHSRGRWAAALLALLLSGCAASPPKPAPTLYQKLGGEQGIHAIVEDFTYRLADDPELVAFFANTNIDYFVGSLQDYLCVISDGPCIYRGAPMDKAHQHMGIHEADFNRLVDALQATLLDQPISASARNQLLKRLAAQHAAIMRYQ
ncbi:group 1 truncated hemoglobin [Salinicola sp. DM10]|uniref:group I truncated hemoglobin n=1 Tax=Salinicola sp. DM10 TaxID=2815721 RepID=UPI001A8F70AC|nr:group 1 truncated hemoglobin [Salinicola sp. DM10]MCE3027801.1 group 1 truncated hemoglobin [Salinicola sp. DM10]